MPDGLSGQERFEDGSGSVLKNVVCTSCDGFCPVAAKVEDGQVVKVTTRDHPILKDVICMKGAYAPKHFAHPDRILYPLKRVGARGDGQWQQVTWDEAMDDIAERLQAVIDKYGPEAFAVGQSGATGLSDHGLCRRFMNHVGSPNWISGVAYCAGNTAAVNRYVYGWFPRGDVLNSKCIVLLGHDPRRHSWTMEYKAIRMAQAAGAKLIVADPRRSGNAERADIWLPLRAGTDAALLLGWLRVIVDEELYDKEFVRDWTVGFDKLVERLQDYPVGRVAEITGLTEDQIRDSARMYATTAPACIPWSPITDQQVSSTSAIRLQAMLRAITGNVDVKGGEVFVGPSPVMRFDSEIEMAHLLSEEQRAKQLGADKHPVFTFRGMKAFEDATERVWGHRYVNLVNGCYMANPMAVFKAMEDSDPYPVRAFFMMANNALMAYANGERVYRAMMKQDLLVSFEHNMTPSAQISDYILPGDSWLERPSMQAGISDQAMEPPGECRNVTYFWHMLAKRMGFGDAFPWTNQEDFINYRLEPGGAVWKDVVAAGRPPNLHRGQAPDPGEKQYLKTGFATPSGKVELYSEVLENLGFDPLPYYREAAEPCERFPMASFIGWPEDEYFRSGHRHIPELRRRAADPMFMVAPAEMERLGFEEGDWARLESSTGSMVARVYGRSSMPKGLVRVPHGWWKPESRPGLENMSGMWAFNDGQVTPDDEEALIDREQGIPHMKGMPCALVALTAEEVAALEAEFGPTNDLPRGPEGKVLQSTSKPDDFMFDDITGDGVEFEAVALSIYGRTSAM